MKQFYDFAFPTRVLLEIIWRIEKRVYNRNWTFREQALHARDVIGQDAIWLSHNNLASGICERHLHLVEDEWFIRNTPSIHEFRKDIGCDQI